MPIRLWTLATLAVAALCASAWVDIFSRNPRDVHRRNLWLVALWLTAITLYGAGALVGGYMTRQWPAWLDMSTVKDQTEVTAIFVGIFLFGVARIASILWHRAQHK